MFWPDIFLSLRAFQRKAWQSQLFKEKYIWAQVRIPRETEKALLVDNGTRT